jgi:hypothetical protein
MYGNSAQIARRQPLKGRLARYFAAYRPLESADSLMAYAEQVADF